MVDPISASAYTGGEVTIPIGTDLQAQINDYMYKLGSLRLQAAQLSLGHDEAMAQIGAQHEATAAQLQASLASTAQQAEAARMRYDVDLKNYGVSVADLNFRQRMGQLQGQLSIIGQGVDVVRQRTETAMANYQQRLGVAQGKMQVADMLTRRSGPQDWVQYNSLLNQLGSPTPEAENTVDPYSWLDNLYQPISDELPSWAANVHPSANGINQPMSAQGGSVAGSGGGTSYTPPAAQPAPVGRTSPNPALAYLDSIFTETPQQKTPYTVLNRGTGPEWASGVPLAQVGKGLSYLPTGSADELDTSRLDPSVTAWVGSDPNDLHQVTGSIPAGSSYWLKRAAGGATMRAGDHGIGPVVVGDDPSGMPTGNEELATVETDDPDAQLNIQPANTSGLQEQAMQQGGGNPQQQVTGALAAVQQALDALQQALGQMGVGEPSLLDQASPGPDDITLGREMQGPGMPQMEAMPHAAEGGGFGEYQTQGQQKGYGQKVYRKAARRAVRGTGPAPISRGTDPGPIGRRPTPYPYPNIPKPRPGSLPPPRGGTTRYARNDYATPGPGEPTMAPNGWSSRPIQLPNFTRPRPIALPQLPEGMNYPTAADIPPERWAQLRAMFQQRAPQLMSMFPHADAGGSFGTGGAASDAYGGAATLPVQTIRRYSPEELGRQPFMQKLYGPQTRAPAFQGFGAPLSNPSIGVYNAPSLLNLQRYNRLAPTEQDLTESLYAQGLSFDPRDLFARSMAAMPGAGARFGQAGYG